MSCEGRPMAPLLLLLLWTAASLAGRAGAVRPWLEPSQRQLPCSAVTLTTTKVLYKTVERVRCPVRSLESLMAGGGARCSPDGRPDPTLTASGGGWPQLESLTTHGGSPGSLTAHGGSPGSLTAHGGSPGSLTVHGGSPDSLTVSGPGVLDSLTTAGGRPSLTHGVAAGGVVYDSLTIGGGGPFDTLTRPVHGDSLTVLAGRPTPVAPDVLDLPLTRPPYSRPSRPRPGGFGPLLAGPSRPRWPPFAGSYHRPRPSLTGPAGYGTPPVTVSQFTRPQPAASVDPNRVFIVGKETIYF